MGVQAKNRRTRARIGRVSVYLHHGSWWVYFLDEGRQIRRKVGPNRIEAEQVAAQVNAQLAQGAPTLLSFQPVGVADLRRQFLEHHESVRRSSLATVRRYGTATQHLETFVAGRARPVMAHEVKPEAFVAYLRSVEVAPNGHAHTTRRRLRDKGVIFILESCRSMYGFAAKRRHLPPYAGNPFADLPFDKFKIEDAKPVFVFDADTEMAFFEQCSPWALAIHFTLAKTGLRPGELVHLLIEDVDLATGWLTIRSKPDLGWRVKTGLSRSVPLVPELVAVLRRLIGRRVAGPVFLREKLYTTGPLLSGTAIELGRVVVDRCHGIGTMLSRTDRQKVCRGVWRDAGAVNPDEIRTSFVRTMRAIGHPESTCPKSWRHTFATLLQDANVDPLVRQLVLGHAPTGAGGLGMTANYTHTRPETLRRQVFGALRTWPRSLEFVHTTEDSNAFRQTHCPDE